MNQQGLAKLLQQGLPQAEVEVQQDGSRFSARIVHTGFSGKSLVQRHRQVYSLLGDSFATNELHALTLITLTPQEAANQQ